MKRILVLGAGKSASVLIRNLLEISAGYGWHVIVADKNIAAAKAKLGDSVYGSALEINVEDPLVRAATVRDSDLVISLLPPSLHNLIAIDCLHERRNLLTASYADEQMLGLDTELRSKDLLFLCEMGLDPGIDHMSAMRLIDNIRTKGGRITSFLSHCGGLMAPASDNNPWHYKISWNPANVVSAGKDGAMFLEDGIMVALGYQEIFSLDERIVFPGLGSLQVYPNRDSMRYRHLYALEDTHTFIRTTIRHPDFIKGWSAIVKAGLTSLDLTQAETYAEWSAPIKPFLHAGNKALFKYLGILEDRPLAVSGLDSAKILQSVLEERLAMQPEDQDMILMLHQIEYELDGKRHQVTSSFRMDGFDSSYTAMATTVGLPLAIAAKLILKGEIGLTGVQIPICREIYEKVLPELAENGIVFSEEFQ